MSVRVTDHGQLLIIHPGEWSLEDSYKRFHSENPHVYETLVMLARRWRERQPYARCGIGMLFEVVRWELNMSTVGEPLRLNNNYRAFYAREIMDREPDLDGIFNTREQRA